MLNSPSNDALMHQNTRRSLELIDEGETDHKIIALRVTDPNAANINNMEASTASIPRKTPHTPFRPIFKAPQALHSKNSRAVSVKMRF